MISSIYELGVEWRAHNIDNGYTKAKPRARKGNVSYEGPTLYSRATPIARFHKSRSGTPYILEQSRKYSISTQQQIRKCIRYDIPHFKVPNIGATGGWSAEPEWRRFEPNDMHKANLEYLMSCAEAYEHEVIKDYRWNSDGGWEEGISTRYMTVVRYEDLSGVTIEREPLIDIGIRIERTIKEKMAVYMSPINVAKRDRAAARRLAKKALGL